MFDLTPDMNRLTGVIRRRRATSVATTIDVRDACAFFAAVVRLHEGTMASERRTAKTRRLVGCGVIFQGGGTLAIDSNTKWKAFIKTLYQTLLVFLNKVVLVRSSYGF